MSELPRIRRHRDGRIAVNTGNPDRWVIASGPDSGGHVWHTGNPPGWSELFVAVLPEPDGWTDTVGDNGEDTRTPHWNSSHGKFMAWIQGVEGDYGLEEDLASDRDAALKLLAAVTMCEKYRARKETP